MKKADLLAKLKSLCIREEQTVNVLAKYCLALEWQKAVNPLYVDKITKGLITLRDDTNRHMDMLSKLQEYVRKAGGNGF